MKNYAVWFFLCFLPLAAFETEIQFQETSSNFRDIAFINDQSGWTAGSPHWDQTQKAYTGTIMRTSDGGVSWEFQSVPVHTTLNALVFTDANTGWAAGNDGVILHTTNGGGSWNIQTVAETGDFQGIFFADAMEGWATAMRVVHYDWFGDPDDWQGTVWHTADGGMTWNRQTVPADIGLVRRIDFADDQHGWIAGTRRITDQFGSPAHRAAVYKTADGGNTWQDCFTHDLDISLIGVDFTDSQNGWAVGFIASSGLKGGSVFHTPDGGLTWERIDEGGFMTNFWDVEFLDADYGWIVGTMYGAAWGPPVLRTMDGGQTWEMPQMADHDGEGLYAVAVLSGSVIAAGDHDYLVRSDDPRAGADWPNGENLFTQTYLNTHYHLEDIFFINDTQGWAVGKRSYKPGRWGQLILHTEDGGLSWQVQYEHQPDNFGGTGIAFRLDKIVFIDDQVGWASGRSDIFMDPNMQRLGAMLYTTDGGVTWQQQALNLNAIELCAVQFLNAQEGWAVNNGGPVRFGHTVNGGTDWEWVDTPVSDPLGIGYAIAGGDLFFLDAAHGWAAGGLGTVVYTDNGGESWQDRSFADMLSYYHCLAVHFTDQNKGWIAGEGLFYTENAGVAWNQHDLEVMGDLHDIQFTDALHGWTAGDYGQIYGTEDGGLTWTGQPDNTVIPFGLKGICFIDNTTGWTAGDYGAILKVTGGPGDASHIEPLRMKTPDEFALLENYPNPFNPSTVIRFTLPVRSEVTLSIYNILGAEIETLYQGVLASGPHRFEWQAVNLPSGVYVCRLTTPQQVMTRRVMLNK